MAIHAGVDNEKVSIPIVKISKQDAEPIQKWALNNVYLDITLSVDFKRKDEENKKIVDIEFFLSSNNIKSLYFFKEFNEYYNLLKNRIYFHPNYKYYECLDCGQEDSINDIPENKCIRSNQFCGFPSKSKHSLNY
jgi:hypothetical protein